MVRQTSVAGSAAGTDREDTVIINATAAIRVLATQYRSTLLGANTELTLTAAAALVAEFRSTVADGIAGTQINVADPLGMARRFASRSSRTKSPQRTGNLTDAEVLLLATEIANATSAAFDDDEAQQRIADEVGAARDAEFVREVIDPDNGDPFDDLDYAQRRTLMRLSDAELAHSFREVMDNGTGTEVRAMSRTEAVRRLADVHLPKDTLV